MCAASPVIIHPPQAQVVPTGQSVILRCDVIGTPAPSVTWSFPQGGQPFNAKIQDDNSLVLTAVDVFNNGTYVCKASNEIGTASESVDLIISTPVTADATPNNASVSSQPYLAMTCAVTGQPRPTVTWTKEEGSIPSDPRYITLPNGDFVISGISSATAIADSGVYVCHAQNGVGQASDKVIAYVDVGPLTCNSTFEVCTTYIGAVCRGLCPGGCNVATGELVGLQMYTMLSPLCLAAAHAGVTGVDAGGEVTWQVRNGTGQVLGGGISNGISSLTGSGQYNVVADILRT
ncbi:hypothetical protein C0Q70_03409 [Pomacea canaliculata]|uniref:Ig-like domain-containing protein n=1 Tax=Pomacea canaliculata TaxID=400727 RepID=A0A2T7PSN3_POMCA|nr:hypothetical protein C0Q70_03409 [Pomacea canaliculata]